MKVHVVCDRPAADRILPRMGRYLSQRNAWSINADAQRSADCNVFVNYLPWAQRYHGWHETPMVAYFTHRDQANDVKNRWWETAAQEMDVRIVTARMYALDVEKHGPTIQAPPPIEQDRFTIAPLPKADRPVVGVAGFTYGDGRKGERLVGELANSPLAKRLRLRASGRGWPVPTRGYKWAEMPAFLQGLNVLLCPSLLEGVPMPPLEAMACGVKVVVPTDVGMLNELPNVPGVYRYPRGDARRMIEAVEQAAFGQEVDRDALRAAVAAFTVEAWADCFLRAVEDVVRAVPMEGQLGGWPGRAGVYMVAFGDPARKCAGRAIASVKKQMPDLPVCLASDRPLGPEDTFVKHREVDIGGRFAKLRMYELAPAEWNYVIYLDADTEVVEPIATLLAWLQDGWEITVSRDMGKYATLDAMRRPDNADETETTWIEVGAKEATQFNGGVMAFRRCARMQRFFETWREEWQRWQKRDQGAFARAVARCHPRLLPLHNHWNASTRYPMPAGNIAILHHNTQARRWTGLVDGPLDGDNAWAMVADWERRRRR